MAELNKNEMETLRVLWLEDARARKPAEIQSAFGWKIENATLRSVLGMLVKKGLAAREKRGKAFFYRAKSSPLGLLSRMPQSMARAFTGGSTARPIAPLLRTEKLSE